MKVYAFKSGWKKNKLRGNLTIDIEKILFWLCTLLMSLLIAVQISNSFLANIFNNNQKLDGKILQREESLYKTGTLTLIILDRINAPDLKVLINGDEVAAFTDNTVNISVKNGDVLEIDGSTIKDEISVSILNKCKNINLVGVPKNLQVQSCVKMIGKIIIE